jgi:hypothetical protein
VNLLSLKFSSGHSNFEATFQISYLLAPTTEPIMRCLAYLENVLYLVYSEQFTNNF